MPARNHHSIGEVLSLLQDDFPDITISKIRFLESQGLISPERTPSGYRRFFERDLELLRWILTQQRDHYLPLKVIREKLAAGEAQAAISAGADSADSADDAAEPGSAASTGPVEPAGETAPPASPQATVTDEPGSSAEEERGRTGTTEQWSGDETAAADGDGDAEPVTPAAAAADAEVGGEALVSNEAPVAGAEASEPQDTVEVLEASEAVGASEPGEPATPGDGTVGDAATPPAEAGDGGEGEPADRSDPNEASGAPAAAAADDAEAGAGDVSGAGDETAPTTGRRSGGRGSRQRRSGGTKSKPQGKATRADTGPGEAGEAGDRSHDEASPADRADQAPVGEPTVVALTRDELAEASGCPVPVLNDLERFGLLQGKTVGRGVLYDNDAVVVARLAARFANHGLEPRHLRSFRLAAEREIGLFAQVVGPLLQRRDAMAHERAMETLTDLAGLASELHQVLVQNLISREFGSR